MCVCIFVCIYTHTWYNTAVVTDITRMLAELVASYRAWKGANLTFSSNVAYGDLTSEIYTRRLIGQPGFGLLQRAAILEWTEYDL